MSTSVTGASSAPNPPSLTPTGGSKDYLWLAVEGNDSSKSVSSYPTNYTNGLNRGNFSVYIGSAQRALTASSENPGNFTLSGTDGWVACTVGIHPTGAPAADPMQINIGDAWKVVSGAQINIGDSWKTITKAQINIGDTWKTIFEP